MKSVMARYVSTPQNMAANAANNYSEHEERMMFIPRATLDANAAFYENMRKNHGYEIKAIEDCGTDFVRRALNWYEHNTDWSAFKRKDWQEAVNWNNAR